MLTKYATLVTLATATPLASAASMAKMLAAYPQTATSIEPDEPTFGVRCDFSHRENDDPLVYPGKKGAANSRAFFVNRSTKHNSTYNSHPGPADAETLPQPPPHQQIGTPYDSPTT